MLSTTYVSTQNIQLNELLLIRAVKIASIVDEIYLLAGSSIDFDQNFYFFAALI